MSKTSLFPLLLAGVAAGCGTTRITDTLRTGTEQLLVSNAIDQAVSRIDFQCLAGKPVYFDPQYLEGVVDRGYLISSLRQHLLASGCILQEDRAKSVYVVEVRSGGVGTNRHGLLVGVPQMNVPTLVPGQPAQIPEIPLAKKTDQEGIAKIAVFAYNRLSGQPVWQSGVVQAGSTSKDTWLFGAGPFQQGTIRKGTAFAGEPISPLLPFTAKTEEEAPIPGVLPVTQAASWTEVARPAASLIQQAGGSSPRPAVETPKIGATNQIVLELVSGVRGNDDPGARQAEALTPTKPDDRPPAAAPSAPAPAKPAAAPPAAPNPGGQEETQPNHLIDTGTAVKPDALSGMVHPGAAGGQTGAKKKPGM